MGAARSASRCVIALLVLYKPICLQLQCSEFSLPQTSALWRLRPGLPSRAPCDSLSVTAGAEDRSIGYLRLSVIYGGTIWLAGRRHGTAAVAVVVEEKRCKGRGQEHHKRPAGIGPRCALWHTHAHIGTHAAADHAGTKVHSLAHSTSASHAPGTHTAGHPHSAGVPQRSST